jgi:hypothetical protein
MPVIGLAHDKMAVCIGSDLGQVGGEKSVGIAGRKPDTDRAHVDAQPDPCAHPPLVDLQEDPAGKGVAAVRPIRDEIKARVMALLVELLRDQRPAQTTAGWTAARPQ